ALLAQVGLGQIRARGRQVGGLGFLGIGKTYDDQLGIGIVLQPQGHVVSHALAQIVEARGAWFGVPAVSYFGRLRRGWRLLQVDVGRAFGLVAAFVGHSTLHGV